MIATRAQIHRLVDELAPDELPRAARLLERLRAHRAERRARYERELAKLDPAEEKALAEEWYAAEVPWPAS